MNISFSDFLPVPELQEKFSIDQRVQIPNIFPADLAQTFLDCMVNEVNWEMVYENKKTKKAELITQAKYAAMPANNKQHLHQMLSKEARNEFQYLYHCYPMLDRYLHDKATMPKLLISFLDWLNAPETLDFIRKITGKNQIIKADAQATRYGPLQFLNKHNDIPRGEERVIAYVLNLTPVWNPDWGGFLQFYDSDNNISAGYIPTFNALNLFTVPMDHAVSQIAAFAGGHRYSITGWFRSA